MSLGTRSHPGMTLALSGSGTSLDDAESPSALQDYIFYLEPERLESGKGKCPYDPKLDTASALISECPHPTLVLQPEGVASASGVGGMVPTHPRAEIVNMPSLNLPNGAPLGRERGTDQTLV